MLMLGNTTRRGGRKKLRGAQVYARGTVRAENALMRVVTKWPQREPKLSVMLMVEGSGAATRVAAS